MPIADDIADRLLDRSVDLARLEAGERRKVLAILADMERQIVRALRQTDPTAPKLTRFRKQRLEKLLTEVQTITRSAYRAINREEQRTLTGLAVAEGPAAAGAVNSAIGTDLVTAGLSEARLRAIASDTLIQGAPLSEWWGRQAATTALRFGDTMRRHLLTGSDLSTMIRDVRQLVGVQQRHAESIVRTSIQSVQNNTRASIFESNSDVLVGTEIISTLDHRTCYICQALSGKLYGTDKKPIGHKVPYPGNPPFHVNCRCTTIAVPLAFDDLRQARGEKLKQQLDELAEGKRKELDGDVAVDLSFSQWIRTKPEKFQRQVLGRGRFELWKAGKITIDQLVDQSHRIRTLKQLRTLAQLRTS